MFHFLITVASRCKIRDISELFICLGVLKILERLVKEAMKFDMNSFPVLLALASNKTRSVNVKLQETGILRYSINVSRNNIFLSSTGGRHLRIQ